MVLTAVSDLSFAIPEIGTASTPMDIVSINCPACFKHVIFWKELYAHFQHYGSGWIIKLIAFQEVPVHVGNPYSIPCLGPCQGASRKGKGSCEYLKEISGGDRWRDIVSCIEIFNDMNQRKLRERPAALYPY